MAQNVFKLLDIFFLMFFGSVLFLFHWGKIGKDLMSQPRRLWHMMFASNEIPVMEAVFEGKSHHIRLVYNLGSTIIIQQQQQYPFDRFYCLLISDLCSGLNFQLWFWLVFQGQWQLQSGWPPLFAQIKQGRKLKNCWFNLLRFPKTNKQKTTNLPPPLTTKKQQTKQQQQY